MDWTTIDSPMPLTEQTIANRLQNAGYSTGMVGKWHLEIDQNSREYDHNNLPLEQRTQFFPDERGFDDVYFGLLNNWWTNFNLTGETLPPNYRKTPTIGWMLRPMPDWRL